MVHHRHERFAFSLDNLCIAGLLFSAIRFASFDGDGPLPGGFEKNEYA